MQLTAPNMKTISTKILKIAALVGLICLSLPLWAQIPQQLNYQGAVRDKDGKPVANTDIKVMLSIRDTDPNGIIHYTEERLVKTNLLGLYSIVVGSDGAQSKSGDFTTIPWGNGSKSLRVEVAIGSNAYTLAGITPLVSVPYALYAKYAENGPQGPEGPAGKDGSTILSGPNDPPVGLGNPGDYYLNTTTNVLYGPQNPDGTWPLSTVLLQGPAGPQGLQGPIGPAGPQGEIGPAGPAGAQGPEGPIGPQGPQGDIGPVGPQGIQGPTGPAGPAGVQGPIGPIGPAGAQGPAGANGINCWDLNGNGIGDLATEDTNSDGVVDVNDCKGSGSGVISPLTDSHIFVGDANNLPQDVPMTGDVSIENTGKTTIANGAVTLSKMANGPANQIYTTNAAGVPSLSNFNNIGWSLLGNSGTNSSNFIGTTDSQPLNFRINNQPAGHINAIPALTSLGYMAGSNLDISQIQNGVYIGHQAGGNAVNIPNSTFIGAFSGLSMTSGGTDNTFLGFASGGKITIGGRNTFLGVRSAPDAISGSGNTWVGYNSGANNSNDGTNTTLIGISSSISGNLSNATAIGANAVVSANNSLVLGGTGISAVNVGIGLTAPDQKLHISEGNLKVYEGIYMSTQTSQMTLSVITPSGTVNTAVAGLVPMTNVKGQVAMVGTNNTLAYTEVSILYSNPTPYTVNPSVLLTPTNETAADTDYYVITSTNGFTIFYKNKTIGMRDAAFNYWVIQ
jgi:hypothetical protein